MKYKDLTDEQRNKIANAKSPEEILEMAKAEGYDLTDEEIENISGGSFWVTEYYCPMCGSHDVGVWQNSNSGHCYNCETGDPFISSVTKRRAKRTWKTIGPANRASRGHRVLL